MAAGLLALSLAADLPLFSKTFVTTLVTVAAAPALPRPCPTPESIGHPLPVIRARAKPRMVTTEDAEPEELATRLVLASILWVCPPGLCRC